jgi:hypothetical protein
LVMMRLEKMGLAGMKLVTLHSRATMAMVKPGWLRTLCQYLRPTPHDKGGGGGVECLERALNTAMQLKKKEEERTERRSACNTVQQR